MRWIYYENCIIPAALQGFAPEAPQGSAGDPIYRVLRRLSYLLYIPFRADTSGRSAF